ncbi:MAG TPA: LytTR family DNA-binding domain-containing protein [Chitinophagaceae bacterium]|nr:LytTR family DNA-binding domain-containing protein [Chitinophagaceae bacterium]
MNIKALVIEDQVPAQRVITKYLEDIPEIELAGVCTNAIEATAYLRNHAIDLIFLDIHLPLMSGLDFLKTVKHPPMVIVTTAYSEFAMQGYELNVIDYLLKPFSFERFMQAVNKVLLPGSRHVTRHAPTDELKHVFVRSDKAIHKVEISEILYLQSQGDFVRIVCEAQKYFVAQTLKHWLSILPAGRFFKVHKSYVVNVEKIDKIKDDQIYIKTYCIPMGRSFREAVEKMMRT